MRCPEATAAAAASDGLSTTKLPASFYEAGSFELGAERKPLRSSGFKSRLPQRNLSVLVSSPAPGVRSRELAGLRARMRSETAAARVADQNGGTSK